MVHKTNMSWYDLHEFGQYKYENGNKQIRKPKLCERMCVLRLGGEEEEKEVVVVGGGC